MKITSEIATLSSFAISGDTLKKISVLVLLITGNIIYAQESNRVIPLNLSYFGETITHPGVVIAYEKAFHRLFNFTVSIGTYVHQRNHVGLFLSAGLNWRHTFSSGYSPQFGIGLGYLHTWEHGGRTYVVDADGNVSVRPRIGRPNFMPSVKLGFFGWDLRQRTDIPIRINADIIAFGQFPFNNFILPRVALRVGATYFLELRQGD